jgi:hypothetical protein
MAIFDPISPCLFTGPAPSAARTRFIPDRRLGVRLPESVRADALGFAGHLIEDVAQALCALKFQLEGPGQNQLQRANRASSIAALQRAIRQLSSIAEEMRPARANTAGTPTPTRSA